VKLCRVRQLDSGNPRGTSSRCRALSADALPQVRSAEFAKAKNLAPDLVNDGDDLSERS
jgi:hypothetical protein